MADATRVIPVKPNDQYWRVRLSIEGNEGQIASFANERYARSFVEQVKADHSTGEVTLLFPVAATTPGQRRQVMVERRDADSIETIASGRSSGMSFVAIAKVLQESGLLAHGRGKRATGTWHPSTVYRIAKRHGIT